LVAAHRRQGRQATTAAEVTSADKTFETPAIATTVHLIAESNAAIYARPGVTAVPGEDLGPAGFAVAWRRNDRRKLVHSFVDVCGRWRDGGLRLTFAAPWSRACHGIGSEGSAVEPAGAVARESASRAWA
jgi:hypothetical protein